MKFLAGEIWTRISTLLGAQDVILLLLCGNKALSAQLLERVTHLNFRYEPQSKLEFPSKLPPFRRLISVSAGRAHSAMPVLRIERLNFTLLPLNLEELDVEAFHAVYHFSFDFNGLSKLTALRRLTLAATESVKRGHGIQHSALGHWMPQVSHLSNLTFLDISNSNAPLHSNYVKELSSSLLELRLDCFFLTTEDQIIVESARVDSSPSPAIQIFPPQLHTLHFISHSALDIKLLPLSLTELHIQARASGDYAESSYPFLSKLERLTHLDYTAHTAVEPFARNVPTSLTYLHLNCDMHNQEYWGLIWPRLEQLRTLKLMEGQMLRMYNGPASALPRSLTSISSILFESFEPEDVEFLPPHLTDLIDASLSASNESDWIVSLPRTCAFTHISIHDATSKTLVDLPPPSKFSATELDVHMSSDENSADREKDLLEISQYFRKVETLSLSVDFTLPLAPLSSFNTPLRSLSIHQSDNSDSCKFDVDGLNFASPTLRLLTSLSVPFCCANSISSPVTWFATLPRTLTTFTFGLEEETRVVNWDSSVFAVLPRSITALVIPITSIDGSHFEDLPKQLSKLVVNGEVSTFDFEALNKLPRPLVHISFPMHVLAEDDHRRTWELELKMKFLRKRRGLSYCALGHAVPIPDLLEFEREWGAQEELDEGEDDPPTAEQQTN